MISRLLTVEPCVMADIDFILCTDNLIDMRLNVISWKRVTSHPIKLPSMYRTYKTEPIAHSCWILGILCCITFFTTFNFNK
jgi:hypothetical protein